MMDRKIPTILGLTLLIAGVAGGVFLVQKTSLSNTSALGASSPQNVQVSNTTHNSFAISWSTRVPTTGMVRWGIDNNKLDNIAIKNNEKSYTHHIQIDELAPSTNYYFQIYSNSKNYSSDKDTNLIRTGKKIAPKPVTELASGKIITQSGLEVSEALVYINISGGNTLSDLTTNRGEWVIPISNMRSKDLSNYLRIDDDNEMEIFVDAGPLGTAQAKIKATETNPVPPIELGKYSDFTNDTFEYNDEIPDATLDVNENEIRSSFDFPFD